MSPKKSVAGGPGGYLLCLNHWLLVVHTLRVVGRFPKVRSHGGSHPPSKWSSRCTSRTSGATESTHVIGDDGLATTTLFKRSIIWAFQQWIIKGVLAWNGKFSSEVFCCVTTSWAKWDALLPILWPDLISQTLRSLAITCWRSWISHKMPSAPMPGWMWPTSWHKLWGWVCLEDLTSWQVGPARDHQDTGYLQVFFLCTSL